MKISYKETFVNRFEHRLEFIAMDSPARARQFKNEILYRIRKITINPKQFRKSIYFDDVNIRDLVFKGYAVVFRINGETIEVFGFVKFQKLPF
jgi:plasmid stabilization system protein ParE